MIKNERTSSSIKKEKTMNLTKYKEYFNNKELKLPNIVKAKKGNNEGKNNDIKSISLDRPLTSKILHKKKDASKKPNIKIELKRPSNKQLKKNKASGIISFNDQIFSKHNDRNVSDQIESTENLKKIIDKLEKLNAKNEIKIKNLEDELYNKEDGKYNINDLLKEIEDLKQKLNILKENNRNNEDLENQKAQNGSKSSKLNLSKIELNPHYRNGKELKSPYNQEQNKELNLLQNENTKKEQDKIEKKDKVNEIINRSKRLKTFNEELKRNKSMDIEKSSFHEDILNLYKENKYNLLNTENKFRDQFINNKIDKSNLLNKNKIEEKHQNIYNFEDKIKLFTNEYEYNSINISQENKNSKNPSFHSIKGKKFMFSKKKMR